MVRHPLAADLAAVRGCGACLVVGVGRTPPASSASAPPTPALAADLGVQPLGLPGDHTGLADDPERFAPRLRELL